MNGFAAADDDNYDDNVTTWMMEI